MAAHPDCSPNKGLVLITGDQDSTHVLVSWFELTGSVGKIAQINAHHITHAILQVPKY